jgi:hypothetical protein
VNLQRSNLDEHNALKHKIIKRGFFGRKDFPKDSKGLKMAIDARPAIMKAAMEQNLNKIEPPGINIFKQVELATKYKKVIPQEDWGDELYQAPSVEVMAMVKEEKSRRKDFRSELNEDKKKIQRKAEAKIAENWKDN